MAARAAAREGPVNTSPNGKRKTTAWDRAKRMAVGRPSKEHEAREQAVDDALEALESEVEDTSAATQKAKQKIRSTTADHFSHLFRRFSDVDQVV